MGKTLGHCQPIVYVLCDFILLKKEINNMLIALNKHGAHCKYLRPRPLQSHREDNTNSMGVSWSLTLLIRLALWNTEKCPPVGSAAASMATNFPLNNDSHTLESVADKEVKTRPLQHVKNNVCSVEPYLL